MTRRRRLAVAVATAMLLAGCGSTVQQTGALTTGLGGPGDVTAGTSGPTVSTTGGSAPSSATGAAAAPGAAGRAPSSTGSTGSLPAPRAGAGPKQPVQVGIPIFPDVNAFAAKFGGTADTGDQKAEFQAAIDWANKHGGLAGHTIVPVYHAVSLTSTETYAQLEQEVCSDFTEDHHVVAVLLPSAQIDNTFAECLRKHGVLWLSGGHQMHDSHDFAQYPNLWAPAEVSVARVARAMVGLVLGRSYAKRGDKVGLMVMEEPGGMRAADRVVKPLFAQAGVDVVEYTVREPSSTADISNAVAVVDSAELKMASQGVKTVMFLCPGCLSFFADSARSQSYFPRYVFSSYDTPGQYTSGDAKTMATAVGVGWEPLKDRGLFTHPNELTDNPTRRLCTTIEKPTQQVHGDASEFAAQAECDYVLQLWAAAKRVSAYAITGATLGTGVGLLGSSFPSAQAFGTGLGPQRHDGTTRYRTMHFDGGCSCMVYDSRTRIAFGSE